LASSAAGTAAAEVSEGTDIRTDQPGCAGADGGPKADVRKVIGKEAGDTVTVCLQERIGVPAA